MAEAQSLARKARNAGKPSVAEKMLAFFSPVLAPVLA